MAGEAGKLRAAVRWLLTPADDADFAQDAEAEAALRAVGVPEDQIAAQRELRAPTPQPPMLLWAVNEVPFKVFRAMRRQVRTRGPVALGLDLAVLPIVERRLGLPELTAEQLEALDTLSEECADLMNEALAKHHG